LCASRRRGVGFSDAGGLWCRRVVVAEVHPRDPDGEDESLALVAADGLTKAADITVVSTEDGQRIVCTLASAVPAGTYYVRLVSHGLDPTAPLVTALHKVTVKAGAVPPGPEPVGEPAITGVKSGDGPDGVVKLSGTLCVEGTNLETATAVELQDEHNETFATVPVTYADGKLTGTVSGVSGAPGFGYVKVTTSGGNDTYAVEYTGG